MTDQSYMLVGELYCLYCDFHCPNADSEEMAIHITTHPDATLLTLANIEHLASEFHAAYERLAPRFGYKTRVASAVSWDSVPINNKNLMRAVVGRVMMPAIAASHAITMHNIQPWLHHKPYCLWLKPPSNWYDKSVKWQPRVQCSCGLNTVWKL